MDVPPLGIACLSAHLKKYNLDLSCTDFRLFKNNVQTFTQLGYQDNYVMDVPDLPLILAIIKNYQKNKSLLKGLDRVIEDYIQTRPLSFLKLKRDITDIYNIIIEHLQKLLDYDIVAFTTYETNLFFTIMCSLLLRQKKPNIVIVYGGPQVTQSENSRKLILKLGLADVIVMGEGEETFFNIIEAYGSGKTLAVKGSVTYDKNKDLFIRQPANPLDISTLSCPDFSILDLNGYPTKDFLLPLYTSRGCLFKCNFCNEWRMWRPFRQLKPERVIEWMRKLNRNYGAFSFYFADSLLNASMSWLEEFADKLIKYKLDFQWYGYFRAKMSMRLAEKLKDSGLCRAFIGVETFSQSLLEGMNKKNTVTDNLESINAFCYHDISLEISNIVGFPYESKFDFQKRWKIYIDLFKKYPLNILMNIEPFELRPSSKIYECLQDFGLYTKKWHSEIINMIPQVSNIVSQIPMSVSGKSKPQQVIQRTNIMKNSFLRDNDTESKFRLKNEKEFLKKALKHLKFSNRIILASNVHIAPIKKQRKSARGIFLLRQEDIKYVTTKEEKIMLDRFNGKMPLSKIAKELSIKFNISKEKCMKKILKFLEDLLERGILFKISFK